MVIETLFSIDRCNVHECQSRFRGERDLEYYRGDFWIEDAPIIDVRSERKAVGPISIIRQRSATNLYFRRTRQHIREDATDLSILWFVKRGRLAFSNQCGNRIANPGDFAITRSMTPFFIECQTGADDVHEMLHLTIPTPILRCFIPHDYSTGLFMSADRPELAIAENILTGVFAADDRLSEKTARQLVECALTTIGHGVRTGAASAPLRRSVADVRLADILRFIEVHFSNPDLSLPMVARGCGISHRYLSLVLHTNGKTFSGLVWGLRLEKARDWLLASDPRDISIGEIAYGVGFKSTAHFSRAFKRMFKQNPREFRASNPRVRPEGDVFGADYLELAKGSNLLQ